jgi:gas vesicle protein
MPHHDETPYIVIERKDPGVGSFLLGILVGAGIGLLFAPRTGEQTREELRTGVKRLGRQAQDTVRNVQEAVNDTLDDVRHGVSERVEAARDAFEAGRQAARETRQDVERRVGEARDRVRAGVDAAKQPPQGTTPPPGTVRHGDTAAETGFGV